MRTGRQMNNGGTVRVGVAQIDCRLADVEANLETVADYMRNAQAAGVELLVFPELALTGYAVGDSFARAAVRQSSPVVRRLRELSRDMDLAIGLIEETEDHRFYNTAIYLSGGRIQHAHRKVYLPTYRRFTERRCFGAGWSAWAFDTRWTRMAILICGDCWHLQLPYLAVHDGANVLLFMAASSYEGLAPTISCQGAWERMNQSYALTLSSFVVFSNRVGTEAGLKFWGGSHVIGPDGNFIKQAKLDEPELLVTDIDLNRLREQRLILPFRRDDSLAHTLELGKRVLHAQGRRRDGFLSLLGTDLKARQVLEATADMSAGEAQAPHNSDVPTDKPVT